MVSAGVALGALRGVIVRLGAFATDLTLPPRVEPRNNKQTVLA